MGGLHLMKLDRNRNIVSYSRSLSEARYTLNTLEQKLVWAMTSLISPDDEDFKNYKVELKQLAEYIGIDKKNIVRDLDRVTDSLMSRILRIPQEKGNSLLKTHWVSHCILSEKYIEFSFHNSMKPYLLNLKSHFSSHKFKVIVSFRGSYTIRLYQLLKANEYKSSYICSVDEFREILEIGDVYREFKELKRNVILPAQKEFEKKNKESGGYLSDITFELETIRTGREITHLKFNIKKQSYQERLPIDLPETEISDILDIKAIQVLEKYGIKGSIAKKYLENQTEEEILRCISLLEQAKSQGKVKNSESGYLLKLLEARAGQETKVEKEEKEKKQKKEEQVRKATEEELRKERENKLSSDFYKQERGKWIASLSKEEEAQMLKEAREGLGFSGTMVKNLESPLIMDFVKSKIKGYEKMKAKYIQSKIQ